MAKILVTGADGFIGRHLVDRLRRDAERAVVAVSRRRSCSTRVDHVVEADLSSRGWTERLPDRADVVIHLAQSNRYREEPGGIPDMFAVNVGATATLLEWCRERSVRHFVLASTGNVYRRTKTKLHEGSACEPDNFYARSKYAAELLCEPYSKWFQVTVLRIFGVYGPGQHQMIVPNMIERVRHCQTITLAGGLGLVMTPLYVDDGVEMLVRLVDQPPDHRFKVFNLCGNRRVSLASLVRLLGEQLQLKPCVEITTDRPSYLVGSNIALCTALGLRPRIGIEQGLRLTLDAARVGSLS